MIKIKKEGVILKPTKNKFECKSAFNPGVLQEGDNVHIVYRGLNEDNVSALGYAKLKGPFDVVERWKKPFLTPKYKYEKFGIEDARLTKIGDTIYMTYVVHDGKNALTAYSYGPNIMKLKRGGIITSQMSYRKAGKLFGHAKLKDDYYTFESYFKDKTSKDVLIWDKDTFFFPEKINNKYMLVHRILPDVQIAPAKHIYFYKTKEYWERHFKKLNKYVIIEPHQGWENRHVGGGAPPIKTKAGWLLLFHGVKAKNIGRVYHTGAILLDLKNPLKVKARLPYPIISPTERYEKKGHVSDVTFSSGTAIFKDRLYIYYGTSDSYTAVAHVKLDSLLKELSKYPFKKGSLQNNVY